jgi:hypothetical protein
LIYLVAFGLASGAAGIIWLAAKRPSPRRGARILLAVVAFWPVLVIGFYLVVGAWQRDLRTTELDTDGSVHYDISLLTLRAQVRDVADEVHLMPVLNRLGAELGLKPRGGRVRVLLWLAEEAETLAHLIAAATPGEGTPQEIHDLRAMLTRWAEDYRAYGRSMLSGDLGDWLVLASNIHEDRRQLHPLTVTSGVRAFDGAPIAMRRPPRPARKWLLDMDLAEIVDQFSYNLGDVEAALVRSLVTSQRLRLVAQHARWLSGYRIENENVETDLDDWEAATTEDDDAEADRDDSETTTTNSVEDEDAATDFDDQGTSVRSDDD